MHLGEKDCFFSSSSSFKNHLLTTLYAAAAAFSPPAPTLPTMQSLSIFWLTFSLASISQLSFADFDPLQTLALQADDAVTTIPPTPDFVVDNPPLVLAVGAQEDQSSQSPGENSIERTQQQQQLQPELFSQAKTERCRRSPPPSSSSGGGGKKRRRDEQLNYCRNEDAPTIRPAPLQQGEKVRPSGNLGAGSQGRPGKNPLVTPGEAKPEWAPPLSDFFVSDPCQNRPYRVCAPYVPGRDFEEWTSTLRTLSTFDLRECDFCK